MCIRDSCYTPFRAFLMDVVQSDFAFMPNKLDLIRNIALGTDNACLLYTSPLLEQMIDSNDTVFKYNKKANMYSMIAVSYTHLDVYKRQAGCAYEVFRGKFSAWS